MTFHLAKLAWCLVSGDGPAGDDPGEFVDAAPGLGMMALFIIVVGLLFLGALLVTGMVAGGVVVAGVAVGSALGLVTLSVLYGLLRRSPAQALKAFVVLALAGWGAVSGAGAWGLAQWAVQGHRAGWAELWVAGGVGLLLGVLLGVVGLYTGGYLLGVARRRWRKLWAKHHTRHHGPVIPVTP